MWNELHSSNKSVMKIDVGFYFTWLDLQEVRARGRMLMFSNRPNCKKSLVYVYEFDLFLELSVTLLRNTTASASWGFCSNMFKSSLYLLIACSYKGDIWTLLGGGAVWAVRNISAAYVSVSYLVVSLMTSDVWMERWCFLSETFDTGGDRTTCR